MLTLSSSWSVSVENKIPDNNSIKTSFSTTSNANVWLNTLQVIYQFNCISDFWCWFDNTIVPSSFPLSTKSIRVFKSGVSLARENNDNVWGGRILIDFLNGGNSDRCWLKLLLFTLSDDYKEFSSVTNGVVAASKFHRKNIPLTTTKIGKQVSTFSKSLNPANNPLKGEILSNGLQGKVYVKLEIWLGSCAKDCDETFITRFIDCLYLYFGDDLTKGRNDNNSDINRFNSVDSKAKKDDIIIYQSHL